MTRPHIPPSTLASALLGRIASSARCGLLLQTELRGLSVIVVNPTKPAEPIEIPFGMWTGVGQLKHVLDGGEHWRHLANTTELSCAVAIRPFVNLFRTLVIIIQQREHCSLFLPAQR